MSLFAKQTGCPASAALQAYGANTLSYLARPAVAAHLSACEFCGAEASLLVEHVADGLESSCELSGELSAAPPPQMPLALRLFAQCALADIAAARVGAQRAA